MKILGIDPGMAIVGYGLIETVNDSINLLTSGSIQTDKKLPDSKRLLEIYNDLTTVVQKYQPDCASVEELFFFKNQKTIIPVAEARGVILTVLEKLNIPTYSYTPISGKAGSNRVWKSRKKRSRTDGSAHTSI